MTGGEVLPDQRVVVENGRIAAVGDVPLPDSAIAIDTAGCCLMSGLADLHFHTAQGNGYMANDLFLFLANGVTTVRLMWGGSNALRLRAVTARPPRRKSRWSGTCRPRWAWPRCSRRGSIPSSTRRASRKKRPLASTPRPCARRAFGASRPSACSTLRATKRPRSKHAPKCAMSRRTCANFSGTRAPTATQSHPRNGWRGTGARCAPCGIPARASPSAPTPADAAECLGRRNEIGTVETGKAADLLLLEANPLESVENVRRQVGVMIAGHWFSSAALRERLEQIAAAYGN